MSGDPTPLQAIGLTGPNAAGKGEAAAHLRSLGFEVHSLSDVVREHAAAAGLDASRKSLIETGQRLRRERGPGVLAEEILARLSGRVVVDSIRHPLEVQVLRSLPWFRLVGIDAPVEERWKRAVARGREGDVPSLETFRAREELENQDRPDSQQLRNTLALADRVLGNAGTLDDLNQAIDALLEEWGLAASRSH